MVFLRVGEFRFSINYFRVVVVFRNKYSVVVGGSCFGVGFLI